MKPFWICNACSGTAFQRFCFRVGYVLEVGLVSWLELVLLLQLLCSWRYKCEYVSMSRICDATRCTDHVRFTRPSGSVFAYYKRSKTGAGEGLGTRLCKRGVGRGLNVLWMQCNRQSLCSMHTFAYGKKAYSNLSMCV